MKWLYWTAGAIAGLLALVYVIGALLPVGHVATRVARYKQDPAAIWQTITDYQNFPSWRSNVKRVEPMQSPDSNPAWREIDAHGNALPFHVVESHHQGASR